MSMSGTKEEKGSDTTGSINASVGGTPGTWGTELTEQTTQYILAVTEDLKKENKWIIAILVGVIACMAPLVTLHKPVEAAHLVAGIEGEESGDESSSETLDYIISTLLLALFGYFGRSLYTYAQQEYSLYVETKGRTTTGFGQEAYFWYRLDYLFSNSKSFKIYALGGITVALIFLGGVFWVAVSDKNLAESIWASWTFIADPGSHGDNTVWTQRIISFLLTIGGMIIFATVIGIISEEFGTFVENLKKGKSSVVETGHTLIIGHGDKLIPTIVQICKANASEGGGLIVVLAMLEKEELEDTINQSVVNLEGSRIIVRSGSPHLHADLKRVSAHAARSIIVLADRTFTDPDMTDVSTVRTVMSLRGLNAPETGHIVCEVCDVDNEELITLVGKEHVETVVSHDIIGRLMIQCAREKGLAAVLTEMLGFDGSEFYISDWGNQLVGKTFAEVCLLFKDAIVIGIYRAEEEEEETDDDGERGREGGREEMKGQKGNDSGENLSGDASSYYEGNSEGLQSADPNAPLHPTKSTVERWHSRSHGNMHRYGNGHDSGCTPTSSSNKFNSRAHNKSREELYKFSSQDTSSSTRYTNIAERMFLNPPDSEVFRKGDQVIVLAEDNDTYQPGSAMPIDKDRMNSQASIGIKEEILPEKMLFIGWRRDMDDMVLQVDDLLCQGSELTIFSDVDLDDREARLAEGGMDISMLNNIRLHHLKGCTTSRRDLEALPLELFDSILILADEALESSSEGSDMLHADSKSLVCLILIRDIQQCIKCAVDGMQAKLLRDIAQIPVGVGGGASKFSPNHLGMFPKGSNSNSNSSSNNDNECSEHESGTGITVPHSKIVSGRKQKLADRQRVIESLFQSPLHSRRNTTSATSIDSYNSPLNSMRYKAQTRTQTHLSPTLMRRIHETYYNFAITKVKLLEQEAHYNSSHGTPLKMGAHGEQGHHEHEHEHEHDTTTTIGGNDDGVSISVSSSYLVDSMKASQRYSSGHDSSNSSSTGNSNFMGGHIGTPPLPLRLRPASIETVGRTSATNMATTFTTTATTTITTESENADRGEKKKAASGKENNNSPPIKGIFDGHMEREMVLGCDDEELAPDTTAAATMTARTSETTQETNSEFGTSPHSRASSGNIGENAPLSRAATMSRIVSDATTTTSTSTSSTSILEEENHCSASTSIFTCPSPSSPPPAVPLHRFQSIVSDVAPVSGPMFEESPTRGHQRRSSSFGPGEANITVGVVPSATQETRSGQLFIQTLTSDKLLEAGGGVAGGAAASAHDRNHRGFFKEVALTTGKRTDHRLMENPFSKLKRSNTRRRSALISEILDSRTKNVINLACQSDYVMSNELVSMVIAMVAEQREVNCVLKELFSGKGNEMHIHPADEYALVDAKLPFAEIMCIARRKRHIAIGYTVDGVVVLNPADKTVPLTWHENTCIIVVYTRKENISFE